MAYKLQYIDRKPSDGNFFSDYGSFGHELLEKWAKGELETYALASEYDDLYHLSVTHDPPPFPKGMSERYYEAGAKYFENFDGFGENWEVLDVEAKFSIEIRGHEFLGIADLVLRDKNTGEIVVIDHKSKSKTSMEREIDTYRHQLYIYALFVKQKYGVYPAKIVFNMFKEGYMIEETFDPERLEQTEAWIDDTVRKILSDEAFSPSPNDYFCHYLCGVSEFCDTCPPKSKWRKKC